MTQRELLESLFSLYLAHRVGIIHPFLLGTEEGCRFWCALFLSWLKQFIRDAHPLNRKPLRKLYKQLVLQVYEGDPRELFDALAERRVA